MIDQVEIYNDLIIKFLNRETSVEEENNLLDWVNAKPENRFYFNSIRDTWYSASQLTQTSFFNEAGALDKLHKHINAYSDKSKKYNFSYFLKVAAILLVVFALGGISSYLFINKTTSSNQVVKVLAPKGSRSVAYLPDGTVVWLNAGSELSYKVNSGKNREVKLSGEAFFKVKTDKKHPFIVQAKGLSIKALGTSFNVKAYPEEKKVTTTLVEGIVNIEKQEGGTLKPIVITMKPNQKVVIFTDSTLYFHEKLKIEDNKATNEIAEVLDEIKSIPAIKAQNVNTELYTSWKDERWIIDSEEFGNLATLLERRYNVNIQFQTDELKKYRFSGTFTNETIEQAMSLMRYSLPFNFTIDKNNIHIKVDPLLKKSYDQAYGKK